MFQSTLAIAGERATSPARHAGRASAFQSMLAIAGERARVRRVPVLRANACFNPRSPLLASEPTARRRPAALDRVSIHARHCWRASPRKGCHACGVCRRFNPRSPLLASEPLQLSDAVGVVAVSIHARHCWRASPPPQCSPSISTLVSIHARHCWRASPELMIWKL